MDAFKQTSACPTDSVVSIKARHAEPVPNSHKTPAPGLIWYTIRRRAAPAGAAPSRFAAESGSSKAGVYKRAKGGRFGKERRGQDPEDREKACKPGPKYFARKHDGPPAAVDAARQSGHEDGRPLQRRSRLPKIDESFTCRADSFLRPSSSPNAPWAPQYTMAHKVSPIKADHADNPGPGAFDLEKYTKVERTRYGCPVTIKVRHGAKDRTDGPGPMRCRTDSGFGRQVVSTQKNGPACSFGRRGGLASWMMVGRGPGPCSGRRWCGAFNFIVSRGGSHA